MTQSYSPVAVDLIALSDNYAGIDYDLDLQANQYRYTEDRTLALEVIRLERQLDVQVSI
jgi:hypothetical protein